MRKDNEEKKTRKFYEMLQKRHEDAKNRPENLVPLEDVFRETWGKKGCQGTASITNL
jgi:hypothetical protein